MAVADRLKKGFYAVNIQIFGTENQYVLKAPIVCNGKQATAGHPLGGETWKSGEYQRMIKPTSL